MRTPTTLVALVLACLFALGCKSATDSKSTPSTSVSYTMDGTSAQVQEFSNASTTSLAINLSLGSTAHDVYLAFTNKGTSATKTTPTVSSSDLGVAANLVTADLVASEATASELPVGTNDLAFATRLPKVTRSASARAQSVSLARNLSPSASVTVAATSSYTSSNVGSSTKSFLYETYDDTLRTANFTLAAQVENTEQNRILNIWVATSLYGTTYTAGTTITSAMASELAAKFLASGTTTGSDIYSWDTGIFGREYYEPGTAVADDLVTPTGEINIVLADLNPNRAHQSSYVYGYFWSVNNHKTYVYGGTNYSNASISFYLDAPLFATLASGETTWTISDNYPADMVSTLAHEFQHMIQYYQKRLVRNLGDTDTWINEMCSMEAEDLLADKLAVTGPRGVPQSIEALDYSTGTLANNDTTNRIALFNRYYPTLPLTGSSSYTVYDYSMAYSFGSWLARNYGGAKLFRDIVQNGYTDTNAVVYAVNEVNGTSLTWAELLREWAASIVVSDTVASSPRQLQTASPYYFTSAITSAVTNTSQTYLLGSIDYSKFYSYRASSSDPVTVGPILSSWFTNLTSIPASGLYLLKPLSSATGSHTLTVSVPSGVDVTVVSKVSQ